MTIIDLLYDGAAARQRGRGRLSAAHDQRELSGVHARTGRRDGLGAEGVVAPETASVRHGPLRMASLWARSAGTLELVADGAQQPLAPGHVLRPLDPLGRGAVDHAQNAAPLGALGHDHLGGVGGGAKDAAHLGHHLDGVEHVDGIDAVAQHDDKAVPGRDGQGVLFRQLDQGRRRCRWSAPDRRRKPRRTPAQSGCPGTALTRASCKSSTVLIK